jgi:hypothetical protein
MALLPFLSRPQGLRPHVSSSLCRPSIPLPPLYQLFVAKPVLITRGKRCPWSRAYAALPTLPNALSALGRRSGVCHTSLSLLDDIRPLEREPKTLCEV